MNFELDSNTERMFIMEDCMNLIDEVLNEYCDNNYDPNGFGPSVYKLDNPAEDALNEINLIMQIAERRLRLEAQTN